MRTHPERREWAPRAQHLADDLRSRGELRDPGWREAVASVPRHLFVPQIHEHHDGTWQQIASGSPRGLDLVYTDRPLITALSERGCSAAAAARTAKPGLLVRMLEALDVREGHRVLEVGTGSGYGTALLAHRIGDDHVFSVDLAQDRITAARQRIAATGHHPTLERADGTNGLAEHGPYDRILAHGSLPAVPQAWIDQLAEGGIVLFDLKVGAAAGNLIALQRRGRRLQGRFLGPMGGAAAAAPPGRPAGGGRTRDRAAQAQPRHDHSPGPVVEQPGRVVPRPVHRSPAGRAHRRAAHRRNAAPAVLDDDRTGRLARDHQRPAHTARGLGGDRERPDIAVVRRGARPRAVGTAGQARVVALGRDRNAI